MFMRIKQVPHAVTEEVEAEDSGKDGKAWEDGDPGSREELFPGVGEHPAPAGGGGLGAEA